MIRHLLLTCSMLACLIPAVGVFGQDPVEDRKQLKIRQTLRTVVFVLDGYLCLNAEQLREAELLLNEHVDRPASSEIVYNSFPDHLIRLIDDQLPGHLTDAQQAVFLELKTNGLDLMNQINAMASQNAEEWANAPVELLRSCAALQIQEMQQQFDLDETGIATLQAASEEAIEASLALRKVAHQRYAHDPLASAANLFVMEAMMEFPMHRLRGSASWQSAVKEVVGEMNLTAMEEIDTMRREMLVQTMVANWKYGRGAIYSMEQHNQLDLLLTEQVNQFCDELVEAGNFPRFFRLLKKCDSISQDALAEVLTEQQMEHHRSLLAISQGSEKRQQPLGQPATPIMEVAPEVSFSSHEIEFADTAGNPAGNVELQYSGFYFQMENGSAAFRMASAYELNSILTDENGKCVLQIPGDIEVTAIAVIPKGSKFQQKTLRIGLTEDQQKQVVEFSSEYKKKKG